MIEIKNFKLYGLYGRQRGELLIRSWDLRVELSKCPQKISIVHHGQTSKIVQRSHLHSTPTLSSSQRTRKKERFYSLLNPLLIYPCAISIYSLWCESCGYFWILNNVDTIQSRCYSTSVFAVLWPIQQNLKK